MSPDRRFEELFEGEGAQPRPTPSERSSLIATWRRARGLPAPTASNGLAGEAAGRLRAEHLLEELFRGEGALPRPSEEELEAARRTLRLGGVLQAPPASGRVAQGLRFRLAALRCRRRRFETPARGPGFFASLGQAFLESRALQGLAALLLLQALALPVVASVLQKHQTREAERARTRMLALDGSLEPPPPLEPIRQEEVTGSADLDPLPSPAAQDPGREPMNLLEAENALRLRWRAFLERQRPEVRLQRLRQSGIPLALHRFIERQAELLAAEVAHLEAPLDLALSLRALILAGSSERVGPHAPVLRENLPRLFAAWEEAPAETRIAAASTLAELYLCTGGAHRPQVQRAATWLVGWLASGPDLAALPIWALAEAAQVLEWGPILINQTATREQGLIEAELGRRAAGGGRQGEEAAAALLRAFPLSPEREDHLRLTSYLRTRPAESSSAEPWPLVHLAWGLFPPSGLWADFNAVLRSAALSSTPREAKERALWLLALTVFYAAPEEMGSRSRSR